MKLGQGVEVIGVQRDHRVDSLRSWELEDTVEGTEQSSGVWTIVKVAKKLTGC